MPRPLSSHTKSSGSGSPWYAICAAVLSAACAAAWLSDASPNEQRTIESSFHGLATPSRAARSIASAIPTARGRCDAIVDVIGMTDELLAAEDLVPPAGDRLEGGRDDPEHDVAQAVDLGLRCAGEVEGARAVVQERRIVDPKRERDGRVRLVAGRADRVEAPPVLLQPAGRVVRLAAVDLRAPELLDLRRRRAQGGARLERSQRLEEVLLERIGPVRRRPAAPFRRSTRPRRPARSCAHGARTPPAQPRRSRRLPPTPAERTAAARARTRTRGPTARRSG